MRVSLAARYPLLTSLASTMHAMRSSTWTPSEARTRILRGLFVISLIDAMPRSLMMFFTAVYSRQSSGSPSARFASTVSYPSSCSAYAAILFASPIPRPSC